MDASTLNSSLLQYSLRTSCFEESRDYVSLSGISGDVDTLVKNYALGQEADQATKLKCRMGYWMERGMKDRLLTIEGVTEHPEIVVPGSYGLIKGHPDFAYFGYPGDCKSFLQDDYLPDGREKRLSSKIFWQMQGYMLYTGKDKAFVVCESRQSGMIRVLEVRSNRTVQTQIVSKVFEIMTRLNTNRKAS